MPASQPTPLELFNACRIIFGSKITVSNEFLQYLQPIGLKTAYRKKAFETHPDRAKTLGRIDRDLHEQFRNVKKAYETLLTFVEHRNRKPIHGCSYTEFSKRRPSQTPKPPSSHAHQRRHSRPPASAKRKSPADHYYKGTLPKRSLLIGQYLYYSGIISWRTLIEAISWQRLQRPKIGQIAVSWGLLSVREVTRILTERILNEKFGECAFRIGYITHFEQIALIGRQRKLQYPIGEYFVINGFIPRNKLFSMVTKQRIHNRSAFR